MRLLLVVSWMALALVGVILPAFARERLAVLVSVEGDRELADNLGEVVIAKLSSSSKRELVGQRELGERLRELDVFERGGMRACIEEPGCLARVGAAAGARLAVIGRIEKRERRFLVEFSLVETDTGFRRAVVSETSAEDIAQLIATVQAGVLFLFDEGAENESRPTSERRAALELPKPADPPFQRSSQTNTVIAYAAAGAALLALSAAVITRARQRPLIAAVMFGVVAGVAYLWR